MFFLKSQRFYLIIGALLLIFAATLSILLESKPNFSTQISSEESVTKHVAVVSDDSAKKLSAVDNKVVANVDKKNLLTEEEKKELDDWRDRKGYQANQFPIDVEYDSYSYETLKSMNKSNTDDVRVMLAFARKEYFRRANGYPAARYMYELAAVYGSTKAINHLAKITTQSKIHEKSGQSTEQKREAWLEVMSLYELAKLRGDRHLYAMALVRDNMEFNSLLTSADKESVRSMAQKQYADLETRRMELGLGKFDNTEPPAVKKLYDAVEASVQLRIGKSSR